MNPLRASWLGEERGRAVEFKVRMQESVFIRTPVGSKRPRNSKNAPKNIDGVCK